MKHEWDHIICNNPSNVKTSFTVFPSLESEDMEDDMDDSNLWKDVSEDYQDDVESIQRSCWKQWLPCFAHSLQLVVPESLKETKMLTSALVTSNFKTVAVYCYKKNSSY